MFHYWDPKYQCEYKKMNKLEKIEEFIVKKIIGLP
jgi:hypothetical protein